MTRDERESLREGSDFEAKLAAGREAIPVSLCKTYSPMAYTDGGVIVFGAREVDDQPLDSEETSEQTLPGSEETSEQTLPSSEETSEGAATRIWASQEQIFRRVLALCAGSSPTLPEIAAAVGRTESTVRTTYFRPLIARGSLESKHPDSPRHPHQAYRTAKRAG